MRALLARLARHPVTQNALALTLLDSTRYLAVLAIVPYLTRVLGEQAWGAYGVFQSLAFLLAIGIEYGLDLSATREIARHRDDERHMAAIARGVLGVKVLLAAATGLALLLAGRLVPIFRQYPAHLLWAWLWAVGMAIRPIWYFQGIERLRGAAAIELIFRLSAMAAVFVTVRAPGDGWLVLALYAGGAIAASAVNLARMYRVLPLELPTLAQVAEAFRLGWNVFVYRASVSLYTVANPFLLGLLAPSDLRLAGYYAAADKIFRALQGLLGPIGAAFYPRISNLARRDLPQAARMARLSLLVLGGGAAVLSAGTVLAAPWMVRLLGGHMLQAAPILQLLALSLPLIACSIVLTIQWMLPLGLDRTLNVIIIAAGLLNLALAAALVHSFGPIGMAWAVLAIETLVLASSWYALRRRGLDPLTLSRQAGDAARPLPAASAASSERRP